MGMRGEEGRMNGRGERERGREGEREYSIPSNERSNTLNNQILIIEGGGNDLHFL